MNYAAPVIIEPNKAAEHSVIWLHGLGADGYDFVPVVRELEFPQKEATRFVFPHAAKLPVTINGGVRMPAWYDIMEMQIDRKVDEKQLRQSSAYVQSLIDQEVEKGVAARQVVIAGFSQGGAVAIEAALTYRDRLAGLLVLSSYFATAASIQVAPANQGLPVLVQHGTHDGVVPEQLGRRVQSALTERGYSVEYQTFAMAHSVCPEQARHVNTWLAKVFSAA